MDPRLPRVCPARLPRVVHDVPMLLALANDRHTWTSEFAAELDGVFASAGYEVLDVRWADMRTVRGDADHFTWCGFGVFARELADAVVGVLPAASALHIIADSTIDHCNYVGSEWTGRANALVVKEMAERGIEATVDAISGSGFVTYDRGSNFCTRAKAWSDARRDGGCATRSVLFIGGWNDATECPRAQAAVWRAVQTAARVVQTSERVLR